MELAARIASILLGLAVMVLLLWPVAVPVGFGGAWWASRQVQSPETPQPQTEPAPQASLPAATPKTPAAPAPSPHAVPAVAPEAKTATVAVKTEDKRIAALEDAGTAAVAPAQISKRYYRVTVRDGGTLQAGKVVIRLSGVAPRVADAMCKDGKGKSWPCGAAAKAALTRLIRARAVTCLLPKSGEHNVVDASCAVAGIDLSTWLVRQGWAAPKAPNDPALAEAEAAAKAERLGLWR
jgi:endonuclease YncB( thermonuclease family)